MIVVLCALWFSLLVICKICISHGSDIQEGQQCTIQNEKIQGTCIPILNCSWALTRINQSQHVDICIQKHPLVVCCPSDEKNDSNQSSESRDLMMQRMRSFTWSKQKCDEFYPVPSEYYIVGAGGRHSSPKEFPHMANLGYGNATEKEWICGGSLISLQHVLTAAHCVESVDLGEVKYVRLGDLDILKDSDHAEPQDFNVKKAIPHPDFNYSTLKHDIAILLLDKPVRKTEFVKPGCLFPADESEEFEVLTAAGWGITKIAGEPSSHLIKVELKIVNNTDCRHQYRRIGTRGHIDEELQVCAGSAHQEKIIDTCDGDSGGPLQFKSYRRSVHYVIIGITSFGKACGITKSAGVYTRVSTHLPWIQSIVENYS